MDIGISSACFYPEVVTEDTVLICKSLGFDIMEFFLESYYEYKEDYCKALREKCDKYNISVNSVHAFAGTFEPHLFDAYKRRADDMYQIFKSICNAGKILGAKSYVFHGLRQFADEITDYQKIAEHMDMLSETAKDYGIILAWENVAWCSSHDPDFIGRVLEHIKSDNLKFTLDVKQARKSNFDFEDYLKIYKDRLINIHISDSNSENSCLLPGNGDMNFADFFRTVESYGYSGNYIIEVYRNNYLNHAELRDAGNLLRLSYEAL
ncbi:D-tagatose 3-epimerase [Oxobacter pfennigii]|uniref:D-tagatose 3-epimerase n=1 Tax=Oxobacter pfennigii TaxID=36849 RepID=A0A0P8WBN7_9CLOT|nr:sugar phosphate isomerase/epimerase [Oxobacter pfennigii]KPU46036.1 D-tagatose 3-epimerase [Oxobacter pfennigii]